MSQHDPGANRILVADGDPCSRANIMWCLLAQGFRTEAAVDGFSAALALDRAPLPFLAIISLDLKGLTGRQLIELMHRSPRLGHIAVIGTGAEYPESQLPEGVHFMRTPCQRELLVTKVAEIGRISLRSRRTSAAPSAVRRASPSPAPNPLDRFFRVILPRSLQRHKLERLQAPRATQHKQQ